MTANTTKLVHQQRVVPVIDISVRDLCKRPYPGHPKGCPNYGKKPTCPPAAPLWEETCKGATWLFWKRFNLAEHRERLRKIHPNWSMRQLNCCLYWQKGARKPLEQHIERWNFSGFFKTMCPEAMGINVSETMKQVGVILEWPPKEWTYQVAMGGWLI